jgi:DNA-directed RNA polymerase specialized sigma24 family protein
LQENGIPEKSKSIVRWGGNVNPIYDMMLPEETVEAAVHTVQASVQEILRVLTMIDKGMETLATDPYYGILEMNYFDKRTQEDIALEFGCSQVTISNNKRRLVKELAMQLFPEQVLHEYLA